MKRRPKYTNFIPDDLYTYVFDVCHFKIVDHSEGARGAGPIHSYREVVAESCQWEIRLIQWDNDPVKILIKWDPWTDTDDLLEFPGVKTLEDLKMLNEFIGGF